MRTFYKVFLCTLMIYMFLFTSSASAAELFPEVQSPVGYSDVASSDWFYENVILCQQTGLMLGDGEYFFPSGILSRAEALTLAVRLHQAYYDFELPQSESVYDWFAPYEAYASMHGLMAAEDLSSARIRPSSRGEFASLILQAVPEEQLLAINEISMIPDVDPQTKEGSGIYRLYNAGILTGKNEYGEFRADSLISRAEAASILCRVIRPETRVHFEITTSIEETPNIILLPDIFNSLYITDFNGAVVTAMTIPERQYALFDLDGNQLIPWQNGIIYPESCGIFLVKKESEKQPYSYVYYTSSGELLCAEEFRFATPFINGLAAVQEYSDGRYGAISIMDTSGCFIKTFENEEGYELTQNLTGRFYSLLQKKDTPVKLYLDINTGTYRSFSYPYLEAVSDGMLSIIDNDYRYGYLKEDMSLAVEPQYSWGSSFQNGFAVVCKNGKYGAIDRDGNMILPMEYQWLSGFNSSGMILALKETGDGNRYCVMDAQANVLALLDIPAIQGTTTINYNLYDSYITYYSPFGCEIFNLQGKCVLNGIIGDRFIPSENCVIVQNNESGRYSLIILEESKPPAKPEA